MLPAAIDAGVEVFIAQHVDRRDDSGRRQVVKNGSLPSREILTGVGPIEVKQGRFSDNSPDPESRVQFIPSVPVTHWSSHRNLAARPLSDS